MVQHRKCSLRLIFALAGIFALVSPQPQELLAGARYSSADLKLLIAQAVRTYVAAKQCKLTTAGRIKSDLITRLSRFLTAQSLVDAVSVFDDEVDAMLVVRAP